MKDKEQNQQKADLSSTFQKAHDVQENQIQKDFKKAQSFSVPKPKISPIKEDQNQGQSELEKRTSYIKKRLETSQRKQHQNTPTEDIYMDREGFQLVDQQYQKELLQARVKVTEKWNLEFMKKTYVGDQEMQETAKKNDDEIRQEKIKADFEVYRKRIDFFHFGEKGRDAVLKKLQQEEASKKSQTSLQKGNSTDLRKAHEQDEMVKEHGVKNIYELAKKIIQKQEQRYTKKKKR